MNIGIAGAGIMGRLLAFTLANNHQVSLYDEGNANCSMAAAGMLAPIAELAKSESLIYQIGVEALEEHWPRLLTSFNHEIYFKRLGSIVVSHPKDQSELVNFITMIDRKLEGLCHQNNYLKRCCKSLIYKKLNKSELNSLEPALSKFNNGYYFPAEGQIDNQSLMKHLQQKQIQWYANTHVKAVNSNKISTATDTKEHDLVFDCRGMGAAKVFSDLQPVRGELIWLHAPHVTIQRPIRLMHPRYGLYVVPRPDNIYIIGASEIYSDDYSPISVRTALELLTSAYYIHPGFAEARIIKTAAHCRPAFSNHLPKIKCNREHISVNGLYRHGFLIAPTLVAEINRWLEKGTASLKYPQIWEFA